MQSAGRGAAPERAAVPCCRSPPECVIVRLSRGTLVYGEPAVSWTKRSTVPDALEPGVLFISMEYATAAHLCACGCDEEVVTPFTPTDWKMTFDGETISLWPSIGNWTLPCRSHYVIMQGRVVESGPWTEEQVAAERRRDRAAKAGYYNEKARIQVNHRGSEPSRRPAARRSDSTSSAHCFTSTLRERNDA